jgi:hypothetical protein
LASPASRGEFMIQRPSTVNTSFEPWKTSNKDNNMPLDVDVCIESLKGGEIVPESSLKILCQYVSELLMEESNVQPVLSPVTIVGDLHGQVFDLLNLLNVGGWPPTTSYIFLVRLSKLELIVLERAVKLSNVTA